MQIYRPKKKRTKLIHEIFVQRRLIIMRHREDRAFEKRFEIFKDYLAEAYPNAHRIEDLSLDDQEKLSTLMAERVARQESHIRHNHPGMARMLGL